MGIVDEDIALVRERTDLVAVASQFMQLKRVGRRWSGLCPFHGEKTPSFSVNGERGVFYCFGCQAKGDAITFVRDIEHLDFVGAVEWLAGRAGVTLRYTEKGQSESRRRKARLTEAVRQAVEWYHRRLLTAPDAGAARRYLRSRGLDGEAVRHYQIGWAPDEWDSLARALHLPDALLTETGLGFLNRRHRQQDFFRGRVLFPIFDPQGDPVSFGGRVLPGGEGPKYRNTAQTSLYDKGKVLYGLHWVKDEVVRADEVIVCEGYTDVIGFASAGVPRAVATCGTALTEDHVRQLKRFAHKVVLAFDPDGAGQAAAERFYEWERTHELQVAVAALPPGQDPGELARTDAGALAASVAAPVPFLGFRVERALAAGSLDSPEGRARTAEAAVAVIAEHPSELVRDQYLMMVADRCHVDVARLRTSFEGGGVRAGGGGGPARVEPGRSPRSTRADAAEAAALRLAVDADHGNEMLERLDEVLFTDDRHVAVLRALVAAGGDLHDAVEVADPGASEMLSRLAVEEEVNDPSDIRRTLLRRAADRELARLRADVRATAQAGDDPATFAPLIEWLQAQIQGIHPDERPRREVEDQLLAWLSHRAEERG